jgi:hypothetical protein
MHRRDDPGHDRVRRNESARGEQQADDDVVDEITGGVASEAFGHAQPRGPRHTECERRGADHASREQAAAFERHAGEKAEDSRERQAGRAQGQLARGARREAETREVERTSGHVSCCGCS